MKLDPDNKLEFFLEDPYDEGYILLPMAWLKQAQKYSKKFNIVPNRNKIGDKIDRNITNTLSAIDRLHNLETSITIRAIASLLGSTPENITKILKLAEERGDIVIHDDKIERKWRQKTDLTEEILIGEDKKVIQVMEIWQNAYIEEFKQRGSIDKKDKDAVKELSSEYDIGELEEYIHAYLKSKTAWPTDIRELKYLKQNINKVIFEKHREMDERRAKKIYKEEDYGDSLSEEQLREYLIGKIKKKWAGNEDWTKLYEQELKKRNITVDSLKQEDFDKFNKDWES